MRPVHLWALWRWNKLRCQVCLKGASCSHVRSCTTLLMGGHFRRCRYLLSDAADVLPTPSASVCWPALLGTWPAALLPRFAVVAALPGLLAAFAGCSGRSGELSSITTDCTSSSADAAAIRDAVCVTPAMLLANTPCFSFVNLPLPLTAC